MILKLTKLLIKTLFTLTLILWLFVTCCVFIFGFFVGSKNGFTYLIKNGDYYSNTIFKSVKAIAIAGLVGGCGFVTAFHLYVCACIYFYMNVMLKDKNE